MSIEAIEETSVGTKPIPEHEWLTYLVGEWKIVTDMGEGRLSEGTESVQNFDGLWALGEGHGKMPDCSPHNYYTGLGYDVSAKNIAASYFQRLLTPLETHRHAEQGRKKDDPRLPRIQLRYRRRNRAYRDIIELITEDHRTLTSMGQDEKGEWVQ